MSLCAECSKKIKKHGASKFDALCDKCKQKQSDAEYLLKRRIKLMKVSEFEVFKLRSLKSSVLVEQL